jgi:AAA domain
MSLAHPDEPLPQVQFLNQVVARPIDYLWQGRLTFGKPALIDGEPGVGKSLIGLDLCARLSTGRPMPDGSPGPGVTTSLILQCEDGLEDTVAARVQALGGDMSRIAIWRARSDTEAPLRLPSGCDLLERAVRQTGARFVLIDPMTAFLDPHILLSSEQAVRQALAPVVQLAERTRAVLQFVRHLNKAAGGRAINRGLGSIAFAGVFRSVWIVGRDPQWPGRFVLAPTKVNNGPPPPSLGYEITSGADGAPRIVWHGERPWTADQSVAAGRAAPQRDRAGQFLVEFLKDGPRLSREIWTTGRDRGLSDSAMKSAREQIGITYRRVYRNGVKRTYWLLPGQELPAELGGPDPDNEWFKFIAEQEKEFPPPSPLDDDDDDHRYLDNED